MDKFTIKVDTREQCPFKFSKNKYCDGTVVQTIKHGDYSICGLEDLIFCERKYCIGEWSKNVTQSRFKKLLENAASYKYRLICCSFPYMDILDFPNSLKVSPYVKRKIRITPEYIKKFTAQLPIIYDIPIMFFNFQSHAEQFVFDWLKEIWRKEGG